MSPYIKQDRRTELDPEIDILIEKAKRVGELNYIITRLLDGYIHKFAGIEGIDYNAINAIMGVFECAKLEFYRRQAAKYEDKKKKLNSEVYL